jgi:hypothetical protein
MVAAPEPVVVPLVLPEVPVASVPDVPPVVDVVDEVEPPVLLVSAPVGAVVLVPVALPAPASLLRLQADSISAALVAATRAVNRNREVVCM